jgi:hypothetical protein
MKTEETLANHETDLEALDFVELGRVSEETRGTPWGHSWDGGFGLRLP